MPIRSEKLDEEIRLLRAEQDAKIKRAAREIKDEYRLKLTRLRVAKSKETKRCREQDLTKGVLNALQEIEDRLCTRTVEEALSGLKKTRVQVNDLDLPVVGKSTLDVYISFNSRTQVTGIMVMALSDKSRCTKKKALMAFTPDLTSEEKDLIGTMHKVRSDKMLKECDGILARYLKTLREQIERDGKVKIRWDES